MEMMMKCLSLLLLTCSLSTGQLQPESDNEIIQNLIETQSQGREQPNTSCQRHPEDIQAVLRDMSASLAELKVEMRYLKEENGAHEVKLQEQMSTVEKLKKQYETQAEELMSIKTQTNNIQTQTNSTEVEVEALKREKVKVAFSATLLASGSETVGPFNTHTHLIFRNVVTNIGNAYKSDTGLFIAPVRGAYHFEYSVYGQHATGAVLVKNGQHIVIAHESNGNLWGSATKGSTLLLEEGDTVFLRLWSNARIFDNENHHNTFSGHLLFVM